MAFFSGNKQADDQDQTAKNIFIFDLVAKNVLVTGSNGQLGSELKRAVEKHSDNLHFIFTDASELDITDANALAKFVENNSIKYIINCAAYTAVDKAEDDIDLCYKINKEGPLNIGKVASAHDIKVIHVSTDYVYDGTKDNPYTELDQTNPKSVYGKSKEEGEIALLENNSNSIVIRTAWLYSIYGNNFVKTMLRLGSERESLSVVADQTGTPTNAADLARAIVKILDYSEASTNFKSGIYLYSNEGIATWYDFTVQIFKDANITNCKVSPITTDQYPTKATRPQYSVLDKTKIKKTFDLDIPQWQDSLVKCIKELG